MTEPGGASSSDGTGSFRVYLGGLVFLHLLLGALLFEPTLFTGGDNVRYMILGESLRSAGGYLDLHLPGAPVHAKYPPGYPGLLAVLGLVGGVQLFKAASLAFTAATVALTGVLGRRLFRTEVGLAAAAVMAVNPVLLQYSHWVLTEASFVVLVMAALWAWESGRGRPVEAATGGPDAPDEGGGRLTWAALALASVAFLTRTAGLPLLAAAVLLPLARRRWRTAALSAGVVLVVAGGWAAFQTLVAPDRAGYLAELLMVDPYAPERGTIGPAGLLARTAENVWLYVGAVLPASFLTEPTAGRVAPSAGRIVLGLSMAAAVLGGWVRRSLGGMGPAELFAVLYAAVIAVWPSVWTDQRFLLPLLPLVAIYALGGAVWAVEAATRSRREVTARARRVVVSIVAAGTMLPGVLDAADRVPERLDCLADWHRGHPCVDPGYAAFFEMARWAGENTPPDAVVANRKPEFFWWFGRRQGAVYPFSGSPDVVLHGLDEMGAEYVVLDGIFSTSLRYLRPAVLERQDRFELLHRTGPPPVLLLRYLSPPVSAAR